MSVYWHDCSLKTVYINVDRNTCTAWYVVLQYCPGSTSYSFRTASFRILLSSYQNKTFWTWSFLPVACVHYSTCVSLILVTTEKEEKKPDTSTDQISCNPEKCHDKTTHAGGYHNHFLPLVVHQCTKHSMINGLNVENIGWEFLWPKVMRFDWHCSIYSASVFWQVAIGQLRRPFSTQLVNAH